MNYLSKAAECNAVKLVYFLVAIKGIDVNSFKYYSCKSPLCVSLKYKNVVHKLIELGVNSDDSYYYQAIVDSSDENFLYYSSLNVCTSDFMDYPNIDHTISQHMGDLPNIDIL